MKDLYVILRDIISSFFILVYDACRSLKWWLDIKKR